MSQSRTSLQVNLSVNHTTMSCCKGQILVGDTSFPANIILSSASEFSYIAEDIATAAGLEIQKYETICWYRDGSRVLIRCSGHIACPCRWIARAVIDNGQTGAARLAKISTCSPSKTRSLYDARITRPVRTNDWAQESYAVACDIAHDGAYSEVRSRGKRGAQILVGLLMHRIEL